MNLIVGDYFAFASELLDTIDDANELIAWLRSKTTILAEIRRESIARFGKALAVLRVVLTRWTSHFRAYERLLLLRTVLEAILSLDRCRTEQADRLVLTWHDRSSKQKAEDMEKLIQNGAFWHNLTRHVIRCASLNCY